MRRLMSLLLGLCACASSSPAPVFHDEKYLRFGVDQNEEADAVIESQKARDYALGFRLNGQYFTALGFVDAHGRSSAVRILTARGTAVALDSRPEGQIQPAATYALLAPPIADTFDADHDGFDEVFVEERTPGKTCLQVYRVRDVGYVDRVVVEARVFGQDVCPTAAVDLNGDGTVELLTELELQGFPRASGGAPARRVLLPLWADQHRFVARAGTAAQRAWLAQARTRREAELEQARGRLDVPSCYGLAIELAALVYLDGGDREAQLGAFDRALAGLVLQPAQAAVNVRARARIYNDWNKLESEPPAAAAHATLAAKGPPEQPAGPQLKAATPPHELRPAPRIGAVAAPADYDGPPLADGDLVITPQNAPAKPKAAPSAPSAPAAPLSAQLATPEVTAYRTKARELGNAAFAARTRAAEARRASAAERQEAQAARQRLAQAPDAASAAELRQIVADHTAAAQRYAAEAAEQAAEAARQRAALDAHKATAPAVLAPAHSGGPMPSQ
jgi:hypothetical protein